MLKIWKKIEPVGKKAIGESHGGIARIGSTTADDISDANGEDKAS